MNHTTEHTPILLSPTATAECLSISMSTLKRLRASDDFPKPIRFRSKPRWKYADVLAWADTLPTQLKEEHAGG